MSDVYIHFVRENLQGTVAVGSYLSDVLKRFGVRCASECDRSGDIHDCEVAITVGDELLSPLTAVEMEHFGASRRRTNRRLACEARIVKPGEIVIMTDEKQETPKAEAPKKDKFQAEFEALPLEKKIASLLRMEAVTLGETVAYVVNSPMKVVEKVGDVIAEFGMKLEQEAKKASRPKEPVSEPGAAGGARKSKGGGTRKSSGRSTKP
jgi:ferredoxin